MNPLGEISIDDLMQHVSALYGYAQARLRDHHLCEDLVQDCLIAAWKSRANYQGDSPLQTWLTGILRHKMMDHHRSASRRPVESLDDRTGRDGFQEELFQSSGDWAIDPNHGMRDMMRSPAKAAQNADLRRWIAFCMEKLPDRLHVLFTAREVDELPVAEAAKIAGVTTGSAAVMLTRARQMLRLCLQESLNR